MKKIGVVYLGTYIGTLLLCSLSNMLYAEQVETDCLIEPHMVIKVGSPIMGIIDKIPVDRGMSIKKGELLAELQTELEVISVKLARESFLNLEQQYLRLKTLRAKSLASIESIDKAQSDMKIAQLELERREVMLRQKTILSPVNGIVITRSLSPGEYVYEQTPILTIAQTDNLNVEIILPIKNYGKIKKGMKARINPENPIGGEYSAEVIVIDKVLDAASSSFGVRLNLPNPDLKIPSGLKCTATFGL